MIISEKIISKIRNAFITQKPQKDLTSGKSFLGIFVFRGFVECIFRILLEIFNTFLLLSRDLRPIF